MSVLLIPNKKQENIKKDMTDSDKKDTGLATITDRLEKDIEEIISQVPLSPETQMMMSIKAHLPSGFLIDGTDAVSVDICVNSELVPGTRKLQLLVCMQDFEPSTPGSVHNCGLVGRFCRFGIFYWRPTALAANDLFPVGPNARRQITKKFTVSIAARALARAQRDYTMMAKFLTRRGIGGVFDANWPRVTTSCFVMLNAMLFYQVDAPGDNNWHSIEAHSEAFIFKPAPLRVEGIQPRENVFHLSDNNSCLVRAALNRPFNAVYDHLDGAELRLHNGSSVAIENTEFHGDKIQLDLSDCIRDPAFIVYYAMPWPRFAGADIRLWGRLGPPDGSGNTFDCTVGFGFHVMASSAPSKEERRQRRYSEIEDELFE